MARKRTPGLVKRNGVWHLDKIVGGQRLCESCRTGDLEEANRYLARRLEEIRQASVYGVRPSRNFEAAATKFLNENLHKRSIADDAQRLRQVMPYIGHIALDRLHMGVMESFICDRKSQGIAPGTINHTLKVIRHILNLAATEWLDEYGLTWLACAPKIRLLPDHNKRQPHPLSWDEQDQLLRELPPHLAIMALFVINTGCRDSEVCRLHWDEEMRVPTLATSVFILPGRRVKNGDDRLIVLNRVALSIIEAQRGKHPEYVFTFRGHPVTRMLNHAWIKARARAGLPEVRVHDLRHTYGRRLRAAGVPFEDRQDLLGHRSGRITTHYCAPELARLLEGANRISERDQHRPELVILRRRNELGESRKIPANF